MIISLDIGFRATGYSIWHKGMLLFHGIITTKPGKKTRKSEDYADRAAQIALQLRDLIRANKVKALVAELPNGGAKSARAISQMAMASGVVSAVAALLDLPIEWVTPGETKKAVTGNLNAGKKEIQDAIRKLYPKAKFPKASSSFEHIADSCGAYHAARTSNVVRIFG